MNKSLVSPYWLCPKHVTSYYSVVGEAMSGWEWSNLSEEKCTSLTTSPFLMFPSKGRLDKATNSIFTNHKLYSKISNFVNNYASILIYYYDMLPPIITNFFCLCNLLRINCIGCFRSWNAWSRKSYLLLSVSTPTLVFHRLIILASYYLSLLKPLCKINHFYQAISDQTDQWLHKIIYYTRLHENEDVDLIKGWG